MPWGRTWWSVLGRDRCGQSGHRGKGPGPGLEGARIPLGDRGAWSRAEQGSAWVPGCMGQGKGRGREEGRRRQGDSDDAAEGVASER